jgi:acetyl-CoA carboxylase biotin carboxyl carrier protein
MAKKLKSELSTVQTQIRGVDLPEVERLLDFMQKNNLEEFEYERNGLRIRLKKPSAVLQGPLHPLRNPEIVVAGAPSGNPGSSGTGVEGVSGSSRDAAGDAALYEDLFMVKSPIVGTFYSAPNPNAEEFVSIGGHVEIGQVLCIIEAMKLMNEIESEIAGEVVKIFVENGQPVEYGEPLFGIHPHRKK